MFLNEEPSEQNCASLYHLTAINQPNNFIKIQVNNTFTKALLDTGADKSFIRSKLCESLNLKLHKAQKNTHARERPLLCKY